MRSHKHHQILAYYKNFICRSYWVSTWGKPIFNQELLHHYFWSIQKNTLSFMQYAFPIHERWCSTIISKYRWTMMLDPLWRWCMWYPVLWGYSPHWGMISRACVHWNPPLELIMHVGMINNSEPGGQRQVLSCVKFLAFTCMLATSFVSISPRSWKSEP